MNQKFTSEKKHQPKRSIEDKNDHDLLMLDAHRHRIRGGTTNQTAGTVRRTQRNARGARVIGLPEREMGWADLRALFQSWKK